MPVVLPLAIALKALRGNVMRTLQTMLGMLGVIIGVGAVICMVSIGESAWARIRDAIVNIGANMVWVEAGGVNRNGVRPGSGGTRTWTVGDLLFPSMDSFGGSEGRRLNRRNVNYQKP